MKKQCILILLYVLTVSAGIPMMGSQSEQKPTVLTNETVIKMVKAGVPTDVIVKTVQESDGSFSLLPDDLIALKEAGVPDEVVRAMAAKQSGKRPGEGAGTPPASKPQSGAPSPPGQSAQTAQFSDANYLVKAPGQEKGQEVEGTLVLDPGLKSLRFIGKNNVTQLEVSYSTITSLLYERAAKPRYGTGLLLAWPLLFTKSKKHFLTVQYKPEGAEGQFAIIRLHKKNFQMCLATIEAQTGKKVERTEER